MKNKELAKLFINQDCDLEEPEIGHEERFQDKVEKSRNSKSSKSERLVVPLWKSWIAIAASIVFIILIAGSFLSSNVRSKSADLATISPEMKQTQEFYSKTIRVELEKLNSSESPETKIVIADALIQLEQMDIAYKRLRIDLTKSGKDKRVIFAMVSNLQQRLDLLSMVLNQIKEIKEIKINEHESSII